MKSYLIVGKGNHSKKLHEIQAEMLGLFDKTDLIKPFDGLELINNRFERVRKHKLKSTVLGRRDFDGLRNGMVVKLPRVTKVDRLDFDRLTNLTLLRVTVG
jgi:hypothetical protein